MLDYAVNVKKEKNKEDPFYTQLCNCGLHVKTVEICSILAGHPAIITSNTPRKIQVTFKEL